MGIKGVGFLLNRAYTCPISLFQMAVFGMEEARKFGARLRELRKQAGMSLRELADRVGIDFTYLSKIENGAMPPPSEKVLSLLTGIPLAFPTRL